jgi:pyroglutamyl-peptidase
VKAIVAELQASGIPAAVSQTAGTFVCNHVFYALMHALRRRPGVRGGFIHVPLLPQQAKPGQPSLSFERMVEAVSLAAVTAIRTRRDLRRSAGATH